MGKALVSVIVVNWNGRELLESCLASLYRQSCPELEVIVVDNNSGDGSVEFVRQTFPSVRVVPLTENRGFAGGNVAGYRYASGEFIALINNDVTLDERWVESVLAGMALREEIGICASRIIKSSSGRLDSAGDFFTSAFCVARPGEDDDPAKYDRQMVVPGACAAAVLYRKKMLDQIGFLDEEFFLNHEDTDLNLRALVTGWQCLYVPDAVAHHKVSASIGVLSDTSVYYSARNSLWVWVKNVPGPLLFRLFLSRLFYELASGAAFCILHRKWRPYLKGKLASVRGLSGMLRKRKSIQPLVKKSCCELQRDLLPVHRYLLERVGLLAKN